MNVTSPDPTDLAHSGSLDELYRLLTLHIENEADRARLVALTSQGDATEPPPPVQAGADAGSISGEELDAIAEILTTYFGPIARVTTKRESRASASLDDLQRRLAALIHTERDRADFIRRLEAHRRSGSI